MKGIPHVRHELTVTLVPAEHRIAAEDVVSFPAEAPSEGSLEFFVHAGLELESVDPDYTIEALPGPSGANLHGVDEGDRETAGVPLRAYRVKPVDGTWPTEPRLHLRFEGGISHGFLEEEEDYARSFSRNAGIISDDGVVLSGGSRWVPWFGTELVSFVLTVTVPEGWDVVSQGKRTLHEVEGGTRRVRWECPDAMDEVHLVAGRFTEYSQTVGRVTAYAFLRTPDPNLAEKYLAATSQYIEMYSQLIGEYPFEKFALVENFWETGYGMPSFTLLGPTVIRLPFILHSSYPHEILHNWWGNSVFVEYDSGNWSEGLTAYLADHLVKEGQGKGIEYRHDVLRGYRSYVREARDFPLREFRSRHSAASQVIGYGKSLMVWHMLRLRLGDEKFVRGLQHFYRRFRFRRASFADLNRIFSEVAGEDLQSFFEQWVDRSGAPVLSLTAERRKDNRVRVEIRQEQPRELYALTVLVAVTVEGEPEARIFSLPIRKRRSRFQLTLPGPPVRVDLDPYFDVFRRLDRRETPPTLSDLFGAEKVTLVLPQDEAESMMEGWGIFVRSWSAGTSAQVEVVQEQDLRSLPEDRAVWILGTHNRWQHTLRPTLESHGAGVRGGQIYIDGMRLPEMGHSFVYTGPHPQNEELVVAWVGAEHSAALPGLARKLPHYGKYSYLAFSGDEPSNVAKGQWETVDSPLVRALTPTEGSGGELAGGRCVPARAALPPRAPLARLAPVFDPARLMRHVEFLAADSMEGRGIGTAGLEKAANYIARSFASAGLQPAGEDGTYFQSWVEPEGPEGREVTLRNVVAVLPGRKAEWEVESVVLGAHYDHLGRGWPDVRSAQRGRVYNGADDNASGIAVLLELASRLAGKVDPDRSIVFVAFSGEEWGRKGSRHYVRVMKRWPAEEAISMINLDSVGRLEGRKPLVLGAGSAREWIHIVMGIGLTTGIEATSVLDDPGGSDQTSFHEVGVPAVQIFGGTHPDYHRPTDDVEKIDAEGLVTVANLVREMVVYLGQRDRPLTSGLGGAETLAEPADQPRPRRVLLGTVPDFVFPGPGVRLSSVLSGSPAEAAGLQREDIVLSIDGDETPDLVTYSEVLRGHEPGDIVQVRVRRGDVEMTLEAELEAR